MELILIYLAIKYLGDFNQIYQALKDKEFVPIEYLHDIKDQIEQGKIRAITILDDDYPEALKLINNPPFVIFYEGNRKLLNQHAMLITGEFSSEAIEVFVKEAVTEIAHQYALVTNHFKPLDDLIINSFLEQQKNVIVVLATAIDKHQFQFQPSTHFNQLLILSEFPSECGINRKRIAQRNRLSVGLSDALIIVSSYRKSGIMNLVTHALDQGKDVYCYPGLQNENDGNNVLIQDGAQLITSVKNVNIK